MPLNRPIMLTGATGQIGWELRRALAPLGAVAEIGRDVVDLTDFSRLQTVIRELAPSLIVNAAAYTAVDQAEREQGLARKINGDAPGVMAEEAKRLGVPLVHYSTDYVFDGQAAKAVGAMRAYKEDDPVSPVNAYGRSKLAGEQAITAAGSRYLIFRTGWAYSLRGVNFLRTVRRLAAEHDELRIVRDQVGSPTWARSIADATSRIIAGAMAGGRDAFADFSVLPSGLYHLSAAGSTSWYGFAKAILAIDAVTRRNGLPAVTGIRTEDYPLPARRPAYSVLDNSVMKQTFGMELPDWRTQLSRCLGRSTDESRVDLIDSE